MWATPRRITQLYLPGSCMTNRQSTNCSDTWRLPNDAEMELNRESEQMLRCPLFMSDDDISELPLPRAGERCSATRGAVWWLACLPASEACAAFGS